MFRYTLFFLGLLANVGVNALTVQNTEIQQNNVGNVEAKLEANNVINSTIQNNVAGNSFSANPNANIKGGTFKQENIGNIFSDLSVSNVVGEVVQRNVGGTVIVVN